MAVSISYLDFLKISCCCNKSNNSIIIKKALYFIDSALNEENFALNKVHDIILKKLTLDKELDELLVCPSINVDRDISSNIFLESLNTNEGEDEDENENNNANNNVKDDIKESKDLNNEEVTKKYYELDQRESRNKSLLELHLMNNI